MMNDPIPGINPEQFETLKSEIKALNTQLENDSYDNAEQAFSVSCFMGVILIIIITVIVLLVSRWQTAGIVFLMAAALSLGVSSWLALRARAGNLTNTFKLVTAPKIDTLLNDLDISKDQFGELAYKLLPEGAPLLAFLPRPNHLDEVNNHAEQPSEQ